MFTYIYIYILIGILLVAIDCIMHPLSDEQLEKIGVDTNLKHFILILKAVLFWPLGIFLYILYLIYGDNYDR